MAEILRLKNGAKGCIVQISARAFERVFTCKNRRRYSRERAPQSLGGNFNSKFIRLLGPVPDGPADCSRGAGWRAARHAVRGAAAFVVVSLATVALDRDEGLRPYRERILVEGCAVSGGYTVSERRALSARAAIRFF